MQSAVRRALIGSPPQDGFAVAAWGSAPGFEETQTPALKARFTSGVSSIIIRAMSQSLSKVIVHIIFSTKNREPWLVSNVRPRVHAYVATICRDPVPNSCASAVLLIMFIWSPRFREPSRKLS